MKYQQGTSEKLREKNDLKVISINASEAIVHGDANERKSRSFQVVKMHWITINHMRREQPQGRKAASAAKQM